MEGGALSRYSTVLAVGVLDDVDTIEYKDILFFSTPWPLDCFKLLYVVIFIISST